MRVKVYNCPAGTTPNARVSEVREADVIVLRHVEKGWWTLWKHREHQPMRNVPWDALPSDVKRQVRL